MVDPEPMSEADRVRVARKVVFRVMVALIGIMFSGLLKLSNERVTEFDLCPTTLGRVNEGEIEVGDTVPVDDDPVIVDLPCNERAVTKAAGWRWPAIVSVTIALAGGGGILAATASRWIRREEAVDDQQRVIALTGHRRGTSTRYRLMPLHATVMATVAWIVAGLGGVAVAAGGAPWWVAALALVAAAACARTAGGATVRVDPEGLTARTYLRRKRWRWSQIEDVRAVDSTYGTGGIPSRRLVVDLTNGRSFSSESLCSTALATPTRSDQVVEAIRAYRARLDDVNLSRRA